MTKVLPEEWRLRDSSSGGHDLLTVDIWDTVLRRRCHPDCVKLHVCRFLWLNYSARITPTYRDPWKLLSLRQRAERELGEHSRLQGLDDEYRHLDVYRLWLELSGFDQAPHDSHADLESFSRLLENIEVNQEKFVSYVDPEISGALSHYPIKRRYFLSDFYLPAQAITELMRHHGIDGWFEGGAVSCESGINKRSGRLFQDIHQRLEILPMRHTHVGDNPHSDVAAARTAGITAVHFQPEDEHRRRLVREHGFVARTEYLRSAIQELFAERRVGLLQDDAHAYGRRCSLLFVGFILHVMEQALVDGVRKLYFFTREGEFFLKIYRRLAELDILGFPPPPADLLLVSRLATFAGSLKDCSTAELMRLWNQYSVQSMHAFMISLGLQPEPFEARAKMHEIDLSQPIQYPWLDQRVLNFLDDPVIREALSTHLDNKRNTLLSYLDAHGVARKGQTIGIVDVGWRGTIQDNIAHLLPAVRLHGYYLGLNRFLNTQPGNVRKNAFGPNVNLEDDFARLLDFVAPIEMLCNSPHGSVMGYENTHEGILAHRHVDPEENGIHELCSRHFQAGVLDSLSFWADFLRANAFSATEIRPVALELWSDIIEHPPAFLASAYFRLNHNETFGVGGFANKRSLPTTRDLLLTFISARKRVEIRKFILETGWLPGLLACEDIDPAFRGTLRWLLRGIRLKNKVRKLMR